MGKGQSAARPKLPSAPAAAGPDDVQTSFRLTDGLPAYSFRVRTRGTAYPLVVQRIERWWAAVDMVHPIHVVNERRCPCGEDPCPAASTLRMAENAGFEVPRVSFPAYRYGRVAPGIITAVAGIPREQPLFAVTLDPDLVIAMTGERFRDHPVIEGRCTLCEREICLHTDIAGRADETPVDLVRAPEAQLAQMPGALTAGMVADFPEAIGGVLIAVIDHAAAKAAREAAEAAYKAMLDQLAAKSREAALEQIKKDKEARGEVFDPAEYAEKPDEELAEAGAPSKWDASTGPEEGIDLIVQTGVGPVLTQPLRSLKRCACAAAPRCVHQRLLKRLAEAPVEAEDDEGSAEAASAAADPAPAQP